MLEQGDLSYCNRQADSFFGVTLSTLVDEKDTLRASQYLIMDCRCFYELKTSGFATVAEMMEKDDNNNSKLIQESELGHSVLNLTEVLQTFEVESSMFNIKIGVATDETAEAEYRTVVITKNEAEIDGKTKLIVMIKDVTAKVRLELE